VCAEKEGELWRAGGIWTSHRIVLVRALIYGSLFDSQSLKAGKLKVLKPKRSLQSLLGKSASLAS